MLGRELLEARIIKAEYVTDGLEIIELGLVDDAIRRSDVEQAVQHVLERFGAVAGRTGRSFWHRFRSRRRPAVRA
jgi:hypothetical protein